MTHVERYKCPYCGTKDLTKKEVDQHVATSHPTQHSIENRKPKSVNKIKDPQWCNLRMLKPIGPILMCKDTCNAVKECVEITRKENEIDRKYYERRRQW